MAKPTPDNLLQMAIERSSGGRNNAGFWLAQQLHSNGYSLPDAEAVMYRFVDAVRSSGSGNPYTEAEARSTLRAEYKRQPLAPWSDASGVKIRRVSRAKQAFPTAPKVDVRVPDPESVERFRIECRKLVSIAGTPAESYLVSRGIPVELAHASRCRYSPAWGKIGGAVIFPFMGEDGKPVAGSGRAIEGKLHRTFGPKTMGVFATLDAMDADPVAITEAPIDALSLAVAGLPTLAIAGCAGIPAWLIKRLGMPSKYTPRGHSRKVYLAFDNDSAGDNAAKRIGDAMPLAKVIRLRPEGKDWNEDLINKGPGMLRKWLEAAGLILSHPMHPNAPEPQANPYSGQSTGTAEPQNLVIVPEYIDGRLIYRCRECGSPTEVTPWPLFYSHYKSTCACGQVRILQVNEDPNGNQSLTVYSELSPFMADMGG